VKYLIFLIILFSFGIVQAQRHDNIWIFGYNSKDTIPGIEGSICAFDQNPGVFFYQPIGLNLHVSSTNIADSSGHLLFYTNGCAIANAQHEIMENGDGLNPGTIHDNYCEYGYIAGPQSALILPKPGDPSLFYIFHKRIITITDPVLDVLSDLTYFSIVDISINNGLGSVIAKNQSLINEPTTYGELTAVKQGNGQDWWILTGGDQNNSYFRIALTSEGVQGPFIQNIGTPASLEGSGGGQAVFSPDGTMYVRYSAADGVYLFDFEREQGLLSNFRHIAIGDSVISGGVAISPNSRYLYVSSTFWVYQYDLWASDIAATKDTVAVYDGFSAPFATTFYNAQLAPDCKIYLNSQNTVRYLHVINRPDEAGEACDFQQHNIPLPFNHRRSLPNFPNYRLGPLIPGENPPPPCELIVGTQSPQPTAEGVKAWVFPNPATDYLKVVFERPQPKNGLAILYNSLGQVVSAYDLSPMEREHRLELISVAPGLYFVVLYIDHIPVFNSKIVVNR
jgi:hypothetical protein